MEGRRASQLEIQVGPLLHNQHQLKVFGLGLVEQDKVADGVGRRVDSQHGQRDRAHHVESGMEVFFQSNSSVKILGRKN